MQQQVVGTPYVRAVGELRSRTIRPVARARSYNRRPKNPRGAGGGAADEDLH